MADENKQIEMKKISTLDELDSLGTGSYTVVSKNGSSYKFDLSKIKTDVDLTGINTKLDGHTEQLEQHTEKLNELEAKVNTGGTGGVSEAELNAELAKKVDKVDGKGLSTNDFTNEHKIKLESLDLSTKADTGHKHEISDINGLLDDNGQEVYQRKTDLSLRGWTVANAITENYKDIVKLQTELDGKVDKVENMELISTAEKQKLATIADGAEVNVQSDWNETNEDSDAFIKNKPNLALYATQAYVDEKIAQAGTGGNVDLSGYVTETELQDELNKKVNSADLKTVATSGSYTDLTNKPTIPTKTSELTNDSNFLTTIPTEYITETELKEKGYLTEHQDLSNYATKAEIPTQTSQLTNDSAFITQTDLDGKGFLTSVPTEYITDAELTAKGYLTQHQSLDAYALKTDIPTVPTKVSELANDSGFITTTTIPAEYVTETELSGKGYLTEQSLVDYAKTSDIPTKTSELTNDSNFLTSVPKEYITEEELTRKGYLTEHQDLTDYAKKSDIPTNHVTQTELAEVSGKVTALETSNATLTGNVTTLTGEVTTLKTTVEGIDTTYAKKQELTDGLNEKVNSSELHAVAKSGSYNDLDDKPGIPTTVAELTDSNAYAKASNIPTKVSVLANDSGFITEAELTGYAKTSDIDTTYAKKAELDSKANSADLATVAKSGKYTDLTDTPTLFSGNYNDLTNKPTLFDGDYNSLTNTPTIPTAVAQLTDSDKYALKTDIPNLATVATSGSYIDLTDTPTIPTKVSELQNDNKYLITVPSEYVTEQELAAELVQKSDINHTHKYEEITGVPTIPSKVSELENDNEYVQQGIINQLEQRILELETLVSQLVDRIEVLETPEEEPEESEQEEPTPAE